jgi:hypothetical protein
VFDNKLAVIKNSTGYAFEFSSRYPRHLSD